MEDKDIEVSADRDDNAKKFGVVNENVVGKNLTNEVAYHGQGTWYLNKWIPGKRVVVENHDCQ